LVTWLAEVFQLNRAGLNWARAVLFLDMALVPLVLFWAIGHEEYLLSALFGAMFAWLADPGGSYGQRITRVAIFALIGSGLTALAYGIGGDAWGWLVLAAAAVTLVASLGVALGVRRFVTGLLLNIWFIIALSVAFGFHHSSHHITQYTWAQTLAWAGGAALWIVMSFIAWLITGRHDQPQPIAELPGDTSRRQLTRPLVMFAVLRAVVIAGTAAIAFGANPPHGLWILVAAIIAMKPSLEASTVTALQRVAGALIGAGAATLVLLIPANVHGVHLVAVTLGLQVVALVFLVHAVGVRFVNYALYYTAVSAGVLTLTDLLQPTDYSAEGYRVLWTLCGVAIALFVMLLAGLLAKRTAKAQPGPPPDIPAQRKTPSELVLGVLVVFVARLLAKRAAKASPARTVDVPAQRKATAEHDRGQPTRSRS
jgi:hypothetical protein